MGLCCVVSEDKAETKFELSNKGTLYATGNIFVMLIHSLLVIFMSREILQSVEYLTVEGKPSGGSSKKANKHDLFGRGQPVRYDHGYVYGYNDNVIELYLYGLMVLHIYSMFYMHFEVRFS